MSDNHDEVQPSDPLDGWVYMEPAPVDSCIASMAELLSLASLDGEREEYVPISERGKMDLIPHYEMINNKAYRVFCDYDEAIYYAETNWKSAWDTIPEDVRYMVCCYESMGRRISCKRDKPVIAAARKTISVFPPFNEDVILYRGGKEEDFNGDRPFLAASFLERTAEHFAKKYGGQIYKILVHKGERVIPLCGQGVLGFMQEQEVLIETKRLHRNGSLFEYYS